MGCGSNWVFVSFFGYHCPRVSFSSRGCFTSRGGLKQQQADGGIKPPSAVPATPVAGISRFGEMTRRTQPHTCTALRSLAPPATPSRCFYGISSPKGAPSRCPSGRAGVVQCRCRARDIVPVRVGLDAPPAAIHQFPIAYFLLAFFPSFFPSFTYRSTAQPSVNPSRASPALTSTTVSPRTAERLRSGASSSLAIFGGATRRPSPLRESAGRMSPNTFFYAIMAPSIVNSQALVFNPSAMP